jgi:hypothetical protein
MAMTTDDIATYYANLLLSQFRQKPKAYAHVKTLATAAIMDQLPTSVLNAFDPATAIGVQLDTIGKYVGVSRNANTLTGPIILSDSDYRQLIKMVIIKNNSGSSLATIQNLLAANFPGQILVSDNQTMGLNYVLVNSLGTANLLQIIVSGGYLPKPMGVQVSATIVPSHTNPFFGFRTYNAPATNTSPFNNYTFYQLTYPWLS